MGIDVESAIIQTGLILRHDTASSELAAIQQSRPARRLYRQLGLRRRLVASVEYR